MLAQVPDYGSCLQDPPEPQNRAAASRVQQSEVSQFPSAIQWQCPVVMPGDNKMPGDNIPKMTLLDLSL
jgi:hypothetical protein